VVFAALGAGMALPYIALCHAPALLNRLPAPGAWMVGFKELLAFPMYGSAIWLTWVLGYQSGPDGMLMVLMGVLALAFAIWLVKTARRSPAGLLARMLAVALVGLALWLPTINRTVAEAGTVSSGQAAIAEGPSWQTYSDDALAAARQQGPVFVNFTAAWCITCKVNERVALSSAAVRDAFAARQVTYLKGDWTNEDPEISARLESFGRNGVPLYLLYPGGKANAEVLPQILTESLVIEALEALK
ncbi:MAG: thioredoxin family protein, partial [Pseudomonadales bacterium]|nr:thioredoxin family protein [Pseudomonadales bacterium]